MGEPARAAAADLRRGDLIRLGRDQTVLRTVARVWCFTDTVIVAHEDPKVGGSRRLAFYRPLTIVSVL